jgi:very-short-patch-repair endonuclease
MKPIKRFFQAYRPKLTTLARENRHNPSPAEKKLWYEVLSGRKTGGYKFLRQKPLLEYIVDFYCSELLLAVEVDGDTHAGREAYDKSRTEGLLQAGISVVRFTNDEVMRNIDAVHEDLNRKIEQRKKELLSQPPQSPPLR